MVSKIEPSKKRKHADFTRGKSARESGASLTFEQQMDQREKEETTSGYLDAKRREHRHLLSHRPATTASHPPHRQISPRTGRVLQRLSTCPGTAPADPPQRRRDSGHSARFVFGNRNSTSGLAPGAYSATRRSSSSRHPGRMAISGSHGRGWGIHDCPT